MIGMCTLLWTKFWWLVLHPLILTMVDQNDDSKGTGAGLTRHVVRAVHCGVYVDEPNDTGNAHTARLIAVSRFFISWG